MDTQTIQVYNQESEKIASLHANLFPEKIYQLIKHFFIYNGKTADVGCGIGRDTFWLFKQGFPVIGIDASIGMLLQAKNRYSEIEFIQDALPNLAAFKNSSFDNILCSAVLMHINYEFLQLSITNLLRLINKTGIIIVSFRNTNLKNRRENGKLYEAIETEVLIKLFRQKGSKLLFYESSLEEERNYLWHNFVFKKELYLEDEVPTYF